MKPGTRFVFIFAYKKDPLRIMQVQIDYDNLQFYLETGAEDDGIIIRRSFDSPADLLAFWRERWALFARSGYIIMEEISKTPS